MTDVERATRVLEDSPSLGSLYVKAALPSIPGVSRLPGVPSGAAAAVPAVRLELPGITPDVDHVDAYREVCGFRRATCSRRPIRSCWRSRCTSR